MLAVIINKIFRNELNQKDADIFEKHIQETISESYDSWKIKFDSMSEEEERNHFINLMRKHGYKGSSYEEALSFLDKKFPNNVRRVRLEKLRKKSV